MANDIREAFEELAKAQKWKVRQNPTAGLATFQVDGKTYQVEYKQSDTNQTELQIRVFVEHQPTAQMPFQKLMAAWNGEGAAADGSDEWHIGALMFSMTPNERGKAQLYIRYRLGDREDALAVLKDAEEVKGILDFLTRYAEGVLRVDNTME